MEQGEKTQYPTSPKNEKEKAKKKNHIHAYRSLQGVKGSCLFASFVL